MPQKLADVTASPPPVCLQADGQQQASQTAPETAQHQTDRGLDSAVGSLIRAKCPANLGQDFSLLSTPEPPPTQSWSPNDGKDQDDGPLFKWTLFI